MAWYDQYFGGTTTPTTGGTTTPTTGGNQPPGQRVWEEDRRDETPVSVDYTSPIVSVDEAINEPIIDRSAAIKSNALASKKPLYDVLDAFTDLSKTHGLRTIEDQPGGPALTKYGKSWDFNPNNPNNLIGMDTHTLGTFLAVDSSGNPMFDSEGKPIFTTFGKALHDEMQGQGMIGQNQEVPEGMESALEDYIKGWSFEDIQGAEKDFWGGSSDYGWDSWADPWYQGHYQGYDDSMSDLARDYWFSESLDDVTARKEERRKAGLGPAGMRASEMEQMYDKNFAAKANPMADPGFSEFAMGGKGMTPAEDIIYSKGLWEQARIT